MEKLNKSYFFAACFLGMVGVLAKAGPIRGKSNQSRQTINDYREQWKLVTCPVGRLDDILMMIKIGYLA